MDESSFDYPVERLTLRKRIAKLFTSGDWMARIIIESLLIVFSILFALAVNQWQNSKSNEDLATQALEAFHREIEQNRDRLAGVAPVHAGLRDVLVGMNASGAFPSAEAFHQMIGVEQLRPPFVTSTVWETSLTTGAIPHIPFDVVNALSLTYSTQERFIEFSRTSMPALARGGSVPVDQTTAAVREVVIYLSDLARSESELLAHYDEVLRILDEAMPGDSAAADTSAVARGESPRS